MANTDRNNKIEYLNRYRFAQRKAIRLDEEIQRWRSISEKITPSYSSTPSSTGGTDRIITSVEKIDELTTMLQEQLSECVALRQSIEQCIANVQDERLCEILQLRYLYGNTWEQIAAKTDYSYQQIWRLHNFAIKKML